MGGGEDPYVTLRALPFYGSPKYRKRGSTSDTDFWLALLDFLLLENVMRVESGKFTVTSHISRLWTTTTTTISNNRRKILQPRNARAFVGRKA